MKDAMGLLKGVYEARRYEGRDVLREMEQGDPIGEALARQRALELSWIDPSLKGFELVQSSQALNTVMNEWYDFILETMIRGTALSLNLRMGLFGNNVSPAATLVSDSGDGSYFHTSLGEATGYTVDSGNSTNRSTTTFAAAASQSITNSAAASRFTFTGTDTIYGLFLIHGATLKDRSQDSGYPTTALCSAGLLDASQAVSNGSILDMVYTQSKA